MAFVLIGFMGAGKTSAARELASVLGSEPRDSDELLQQRLGRTPAEQFELHGESSFREAEEALVLELLDSAAPREVISLGGGSVLSARVRDALEGHVKILLDVPPERSWERVEGAARPLARERTSFVALHAERSSIYEGLADATMLDPPRGAIVCAAAALEALADAPAGTRLLWATARSGEYPVFIGSGLLNASVLRTIWPIELAASRAFAVSDENVAALYADRLPAPAASITIAPGERQKTLASAERVWSALLEAGMTRADHVVALGGGVVGDLAGFCAATYQRGVPVVHLPTSLVAQVDSAYGGKTGVDLPQAKNYVGVYHQPAGVVADPEALATLSAEERAAGWVEVLKTALIAGGWLWQEVAGGAEVDERIVFACARTKLAVVAADERDAGVRQVLNLGHTVGHAIESSAGYGRYRHGEAVGLGLLAALRLSGQEQLRAQVHALLLERGLPVRLADAPTELVLESIAHDKKRVGEELPFVLLSGPGAVTHGCAVAPADVRAAVQELAA
jgi:shikimate kinase / 3-dehydroquinate synthase